MDEILIDEKKYVSSKQAAKITGYAKDYIGQLCREGRVPARLVGRSWYVLETAIQDHRFGGMNIQSKEDSQVVSPIPALPWTHESPRYESSSDELLPTINRLKNSVVEAIGEDTEVHAPGNLQDSWKAWFDHIGKTIDEPIAPAISEPEPDPEPEIEAEKEYEDQTLETNENKEINVPIRTIYQAPPEELLPHYRQSESMESTSELEKLPIQRQRGNRGLITAIRMIGVIVAILATLIAIIGSGYLDRLVISNSQARIISGIEIYSK